MRWFTAYDIRSSNDLAWDNTLAVILMALTALGIGCAVASLRRPHGARGRVATTVMLSGFAAMLAGVALVFTVAAADCRQQRAELTAGHFTLLQGNVAAARRVLSGKRSDWEFELDSQWFVAPNQACPQRPGDRIALAYNPADDTHLADVIRRLQTNQQCKPG